MAEIEKNTGLDTDLPVETTVDPAPAVKKAEKDQKKPAVKDKKPKSKKPSLGSRIAKAWREFRAEFKKIVWCSRKDTFNNTLLVIVSMVIIAICISALDYLFSTLLSALGKLI